MPQYQLHADTSRLSIRDRKNLNLLVWGTFIIVLVSLVATLPQTLSLAEGVRMRGTVIETGIGFRWLRELFLALVLLVFFFWYVMQRFVLWADPVWTSIFLLFAAWAVVVSAYAILIEELSIVVPLLGLRVFQYFPLAVIAAAIAVHTGPIALIKLARLLRWFVLVQLIVGVYQLWQGIGPSWNVTLFGPRVFGTLPNYNQFSSVMAACTLVFVLASRLSGQRGRSSFLLWGLFSTGLAVVSGSRTGMVVSAIILALGVTPPRIRTPRFIPYAFALLAALSLVIAVTNPEMTGRHVDLTREGRIPLWEEAMGTIEGPPQLLFGTGLGLATNSINTVFGPNVFPDALGNPHNTFLGVLLGFGLPGLLIYLLALFSIAARCNPVIATPTVIAMILLGMTYSIWEFFPTNVILMTVAGTVAGNLKAQPGRAPALQPAPAASA